MFYFQKITEEEGLTEWVHPERKREQKKKKKEDNPEGKKKKGNEKEKVRALGTVFSLSLSLTV